MASSMRSFVVAAWLGLLSLVLAGNVSASQPVLIGLDAELGFRNSTSAEAIKQGIQLAIDDINKRGGVLGGRPLELVERPNNTIPARSIANIRELAAMPDMVAVFCGRFSPTVLEALPTIFEQKVLLLNPWSAANAIVDNGRSPNFVFRLSLRDDWAAVRMVEHLSSKKVTRIGLMMLNTSWGRSTQESVLAYVAKNSPLTVVDTQWINWDDTVDTIKTKYQRLIDRKAQGILLTANADEASLLSKAMLSFPKSARIPVASHWGVLGGDLPKMVGPGFDELDFAVVQTFSFNGNKSPKALGLVAAHNRRFGTASAQDIMSPVGVAHAYDLTQILARAINKAGSTDRSAIQSAMEKLEPYDGVVKNFKKPFAANRHEALEPGDVFMSRYRARDGLLEKISTPRVSKTAS